MHQLLVGATPFKGRSDYLSMQRVLQGPAQLILGSLSTAHLTDCQLELLQSVLVIDQNVRPTAAQLKELAFFEGVEWDQLHCSGEPEPSEVEQIVTECVVQLLAGSAAGQLQDSRVSVLTAHHMRVRGELCKESTLAAVYGADRLNRVHEREVPGLSISEEGRLLESERTKSHIVHLSNPRVGADWSGAALERVVDKINQMIPAPVVVVVSGQLTDADPSDEGAYLSQVAELKQMLSALRAHVTVVTVPTVPATADALRIHCAQFGNDYYSLWIGTSLFIAVNFELCVYSPESNDADETVLAAQARQAEWFKQQLYLGKSAARYTYVLSASPWFIKNASEASGLVRDAVDLMQETDVSASIAGGDKNGVGVLPSKGEVYGQVNLLSIVTESLSADSQPLRVCQLLEGKDLDHKAFTLSSVPTDFCQTKDLADL